SERCAVLLREEREPARDDLGDLDELLVGLVVDVPRRRHLELDYAPDALEHGDIGGCRDADGHCSIVVVSPHTFTTGARASILGRARRRSSPSAVAGIILLQHAKRRAHVVEVVEGLVGDTLLVEPLREAVPREAQIGGERDAAVGVAVARVGERAERTDGAPFAALPADLAERAFGERGAPAVCPGCDVVRDDPGADALP